MIRLLIVLTGIIQLAASGYIPDKTSVGRSSNDRIVGGTLTDISKHPHQISMRYKSCSTCSFNHRCGGSIISKSLILTAAHCVNTITESKKLQIVAGANQRNGRGVIMPVNKIVVHENYQASVSYENDIAILKLDSELPLNDYDIKKINMTTKRPSANQISHITGWGTTTEGGYPSDWLLEVQVPIVANDKCEDKYGKGRINQSMLCAGSVNGGKDACQGDSGGPLLVNGELAGVVSWGRGCARPEYPGVYASVSDLRPWIDAVVAANS